PTARSPAAWRRQTSMSRSRNTCTSSACTCCRRSTTWPGSPVVRLSDRGHVGGTMRHGDLLASISPRDSLEFLARMIRIQSYSGTPGESELAQFMVDAMKAVGLEALLQPVEAGRVNAIGRWRGTGGGKSLLFNGHLDTNPVTEGWTVDPLAGHYDDRFVYGIGVSNM